MLRLTIAVSISLALLFGVGCTLNHNPEYPTIPDDSSGINFDLSDVAPVLPLISGVATEANQPPAAVFRVAGPWSTSDLEILGHYYALQHSGNRIAESTQLSGDQINIDWLKEQSTDISLQAIPVSIQNGYTEQQANLWTASASWPDIVLNGPASSLEPTGPYVDLTPFLIHQPELAANQVNANLIRINQTHGSLYGLPWRVTLPVLFYNRDLLQEALVAEPAGLLTWDTFNGLLEQMTLQLKNSGRLLNAATLNQQSTTDDVNLFHKRAILVMANSEVLLQYWPATQVDSLGWSTWDGQHFNFTSESFADGVVKIRKIRQMGATIQPSEQKFIDTFGSVKQLIDQGQVVFWIGDSSELKDYGVNQNASIGCTLLPFGQPDQVVRLPVDTLTLSVSQTCKDPQKAASIAAFLSVNKESLLLQTRLMAQEGYFPVVNDTKVWETMLKQQNATAGIAGLPGFIPYAYTGGQNDVQSWSSLLDQTIGAYADKLLTSPNPQREIKQLQSLADQLTE